MFGRNDGGGGGMRTPGAPLVGGTGGGGLALERIGGGGGGRLADGPDGAEAAGPDAVGGAPRRNPASGLEGLSSTASLGSEGAKGVTFVSSALGAAPPSSGSLSGFASVPDNSSASGTFCADDSPLSAETSTAALAGAPPCAAAAPDSLPSSVDGWTAVSLCEAGFLSVGSFEAGGGAASGNLAFAACESGVSPEFVATARRIFRRIQRRRLHIAGRPLEHVALCSLQTLGRLGVT